MDRRLWLSCPSAGKQLLLWFSNCGFLFSLFVPLPPFLPSTSPHITHFCPLFFLLRRPPLPSRSCVHYSCEAIDCQEPLIRNAELRCSSTGRHFYNGDRCTISCNSGYNLQIHQDDDIIKSQVNTSPPDSSPLPHSHSKQGGGVGGGRAREQTPDVLLEET